MRTLLAVLTINILLVGCATEPAYKNTWLPVDQRVKDLVSRMTLEEKVAQMSHLAPAIERLGVIEYAPNFKNPLIEEFYEEVGGDIEDVIRERPWENYEHWDVGKKPLVLRDLQYVSGIYGVYDVGQRERKH